MRLAPGRVFRGCASSCNDTCPLVPRMAGGLAERLRHFNDLAVGETAATAWFSRENPEGTNINGIRLYPFALGRNKVPAVCWGESIASCVP